MQRDWYRERADSHSASRGATSTAAIIAAMPGATVPHTPIRTLLVANRGEIAVRVIRAAGSPSGDAVASTIAFGSGTSAACASTNHCPNWRIGSASTSDSSRPASEYSLRMSAAWSTMPGLSRPQRATIRIAS